MKILMLHNFYSEPGGEEKGFYSDCELFRSHNVDVITYSQHNEHQQNNKFKTVARCVWSAADYSHILKLIKHEKPDIMHVHNDFPLLSPSIYHAAFRAGIPAVHTLHNYRWVCPAGTLSRRGKPCIKCIGKSMPWPGVVHACYHRGRAATAVVAAMLTTHNLMGTFRHRVQAAIVFTDFMKNIYIQAGFSESQIHLRANFIDPDPGMGNGEGNFVLFVGRLAAEKGIDVMLNAWAQFSSGMSLKIVGQGPLYDQIRQRAISLPGVDLLGYVNKSYLDYLYKHAKILIVPSIWYEGSPSVICEAYAAGLPVLASNIGSLSELVRDGYNGAHFTAGDAGSLADVMGRMLANPDRLLALRQGARQTYECKFTAAASFRRLMEIYASVLPSAALRQES